MHGAKWSVEIEFEWKRREKKPIDFSDEVWGDIYALESSYSEQAELAFQ